MASFRSSTDNYSGDTLTDVGPYTSSSTLTSTPPLGQDHDNLTSATFIIGDDEEPTTPLAIHTLSRPSDWARLLCDIVFNHGQKSVLACLSLFYILIRLPLAGLTVYQVYLFAMGSTAGGIAVFVVVFLAWILEREIGLENKCWDVLMGMGRMWIAEERGRMIRE